MSQLTVPEARHPRRPSGPLRPRLRPLLASLVIAGLATIGVTTLAAPAAAEETAPSEVVAVEPAPAEPAEPAEPTDDAPPAESSVPDSRTEANTSEHARAAVPAAMAEEEWSEATGTLTIVSAECTTYGGTGTLHYVLSNTHPVNQKHILVFDSDGRLVAESAHDGGTEFDAEIHGLTVGGTYTIRFDLAVEDGYQTIDEQTFTIGACPDIGVSVTPLACSTGDDGKVLLTLTGLVNGIVAYDVQGPDFMVGGSLDEFGATEEIELGGMPPGNYYAYVEWQPYFGEEPAPYPVFDWVGFAIEPCQPDVTVHVTECAAAGGTGTAHVTLSNLVAGVEYFAWVTDVGAPDGTPYGEPQSVVVEASPDSTGTAELTFSSLPGDREYTIWVEGLWEAIPPWEEPPFIGNGGNFAPLETVELFVDADFTLQPCPAAPAKSGTVTPALAATGPDGTTGLLLSALTLLALGGAALTVKRLVPSRARR
ncbi:MAG TPA: hypothetical protein VM430_06015 [Microbacterium sp.]|nr:hypothetical protein [Microbacterium sp.]